MRASRNTVLVLVALTVLLVFCLSLAWEFGLERTVSELLGVPYDNAFENEERWRFIFTSTGFASIALIGPTLLLLDTFGKLERSYESLVKAKRAAVSLASEDALTGLPNRRAFTEALAEAVAASERSQQACAVLLLDLDRFKLANDLYGHQAGDGVLREVASRLSTLLPPGATLARLGGDEFAVILEFADKANSAALAERITSTLRMPFCIAGVRVITGGTVGIAMTCDDCKWDSLLRGADIALYRAKRERLGSYKFFDDRMDWEMKVRGSLAADLRDAVSNSDIVPFYQPIVSLATRQVACFEILARWRRGQEFVPPGTFIPIAEEIGVIPELTYNLLRQACADAQKISSVCSLSLNVSPSHLVDEGLPQNVARILEETNFPARRLEIEITETAVINNLSIAQRTLTALHRMGVRIALDDFGTGYSGIVQLSTLPFEKIKIDCGFLASMHDRPESRKLLKAMIGLGLTLGLSIVAEGIETEEDANWLTRNGCTFGQGFLFGKPLAYSEALAQFGNVTSSTDFDRSPKIA